MSDRKKLVDVDVYDLACAFIEDDPSMRDAGEAERESLAAAIQTAIEDWFEQAEPRGGKET